MSNLEDKLLESIDKPQKKKIVSKANKSPALATTTSAKLSKTSSTGHPRRVWPD